MKKTEINTCTYCNNKIIYQLTPRLIQKVHCTYCNNYSHFTHILISK